MQDQTIQHRHNTLDCVTYKLRDDMHNRERSELRAGKEMEG